MTQMIKPVKTPAKPTSKKKKTSKIQNAQITFVLDRSGSMTRIRQETINGYNAFIETQRALGGKTKVSLAQFDDQYEYHYQNVPIEEVKNLDLAGFVPRGGTSLYDAVGRTINHIKSLPVVKNEKNIIAILTDGEENSSKEFSHSQVRNMIGEAQDVLGWEVIFVGANMNAQEIGRGYGIKASNVATYVTTTKGTEDIFKTMSATSSMLRGATMKGFADGIVMDAGNIDTQAVYAAFTNNAKIEQDKEEVKPTA